MELKTRKAGTNKMTIGYKTKPNINGNCKRLVVHHDTRTYSLEEYWSDIDLVVKAKELKELIMQ